MLHINDKPRFMNLKKETPLEKKKMLVKATKHMQDQSYHHKGSYPRAARNNINLRHK